MQEMKPTPAPHHRSTDEFLDVSWEMFGELCRALAFRVARDYHPDLVVGIARAGAIPAAIVASILRVDFYSMKISRKQGDKQILERPAVLSAAPVQARGKRVLLVDEIATSGDTLRLGLAAIRDIDPMEVRTATSFARTKGYKADYFALETDQTIIFPWDRKIFQNNELMVNPRYQAVLDE